MTSRTNANPTGQKSQTQDAPRRHDPEQRRRQAIDRYLAGEKIDHICHQLGCSKSGLYKWLRRYRTHHPDWAKARTTTPGRLPTHTTHEIEQAVIAIRQDRRHNGYGYGAAAIQRALNHQGLGPVPSQRTIYRIVQRYENQGT